MANFRAKNKKAKNKKGKNNPTPTSGEITRVRTPREGEVIGVVEQRVGGNRMIVKCFDDKERNCRIPGALIEKDLKLKLTNRGKNFFVNGKAEDEYLGIKVLEAVNHGFSVEEALDLKQDGIILQSINIKDLTKRTDLERVRARIIGTRGKTLNTLRKLTGCNISLADNQIGIIGSALAIEDAIQALTSLVQGSKQGNVYGRIERHKKEKKQKPDIDLEDIE